MNPRLKNIAIVIISIAIVWLFLEFGLRQPEAIKDSSISEIAILVSQDKVESIDSKGNEVIAKLKDGTKLRSFKEPTAKLTDYGISPEKVKITVENPEKGALLPNLISIILPMAIVIGFLYFMMRQAQGANIRALSFGKSQARLFAGVKRMTFKDVAGADEAKQELEEVVEFLRSPEKFKKLGAEIPKGVLLVGPPGTGKTLLAKAVAGEANVPFFSISASEFVEMFVGVGAARVRDLFAKAKRNAPAILFIDELDAVGRQRGAGLGGSHDEREQTLNQILVEMDGFETDTRVIVMAATNRPDVLDHALLRPGRFDRRVVIDLPDKRAREAILIIHSNKKPLAKDVDLGKLAAATPGFSGADLRNVVNEAAILAARKDQKDITMGDFNDAIEKVMLGPERKSRILLPEERKISAFHEAGHAIVARSIPEADPVHKISIVSRGMALGYTWTRPADDRRLSSRNRFEAELAQLLGGRAAEKLVFGQITTGAHNDLQKATRIARDMVTQYGMSEKLGPVVLGEREELVFLGRDLGERKTYSDKIAQLIDQEIAGFIGMAQKRALQILRLKRSLLNKIAQKLIEEETIEGHDFEALFARSLIKS